MPRQPHSDSSREAWRPAQLDRVKVTRRKGQRYVRCFCGESVRRSIVPHLKAVHKDQWDQWVISFVRLRELGYPLKGIMRMFCAANKSLLFSWTVIERAIRARVESGAITYVPPTKSTVIHWAPESFTLESGTVWDFPRRGDWSVHTGDYRGNWPPQIPRNLIERYTKPGDLVVDAFAGGGTTLIEAWLLGRHSIGLDLSKLAMQTMDARLREMEQLALESGRVHLDSTCHPTVIRANALRLSKVLTSAGVQLNSVKLICAHPPYLDSLTYTNSAKGDLSHIKDPEIFRRKMKVLARQSKEVLCSGGVCAVLIGDVRKKGLTIPLGLRTLDSFLTEGLQLENIVVKTQHKDRSTEFYMRGSSNGLLMAHEYLLILRNP